MRIISGLNELLAKLDIYRDDEFSIEAVRDAERKFSLRVPEEFAKRMQGGKNDPLLLQVLPSPKELRRFPGFSADPLHENASHPTKCILHKYYGRVLLLTTNNCAIHCRFCFRRHFWRDQKDYTDADLQNAFDYIRHDKTISEVILSGGEPFLLSNVRLKKIFKSLGGIPHIQRLRIHTRMPIVSPSRITADLIKTLTITELLPIIVIHCNHPAEIDLPVRRALKILRKAEINVLNQSVLLKGINDSVQTLVALSEALGNIGVLPYYLHLLDKVSGAGHFAVELKKAKRLHEEMQRLLPGYLVPKLVCEKAGQPAKVQV